MILNDSSSLLSHLSTRRSGRPRDMVAPGPDSDTLREIVGIAARTPDHGKLAPWRFVEVPLARRDAFAAMLADAYRAEKPAATRLEIEAMERFAHQAPTLVAVLSAPRTDSHIPLWEQQLSAGAVVMNLLHAAHAHGFVAGWITGWPAFSEAVLRSLGGNDGDRIAGFVFLGTPSLPLEERPRPDIDALFQSWDG